MMIDLKIYDSFEKCPEMAWFRDSAGTILFRQNDMAYRGGYLPDDKYLETLLALAKKGQESEQFLCPNCGSSPCIPSCKYAETMPLPVLVSEESEIVKAIQEGFAKVTEVIDRAIIVSLSSPPIRETGKEKFSSILEHTKQISAIITKILEEGK